MRTCVETKYLIVHLMNKTNKDYLSVDRLLELVDFIYHELSDQGKLKDYQISFDINFYSIERTVQYNRVFSIWILTGKHFACASAIPKKNWRKDTV